MLNRIIRGINRNKSKYLFLALVLVLLSSLSIVSLNYSKFAQAEQKRVLSESDNKLYIVGDYKGKLDNSNYFDEAYYQKLLDTGRFKSVRLVSDYDVILNNVVSFTPDSYFTRVAEIELTNVNPLTKQVDDDTFVIVSTQFANANKLMIGDTFQIDFNQENYDLTITNIVDAKYGEENLIITNDAKIHGGLFERAELVLSDESSLEDVYSEYSEVGYQIYFGDANEQGRILLMINSISERIISLLVVFSLVLVAFVVLFIVKDRRKEIGVYLSLGSSKLRIFALIMSEVFFVTIIATTLSLVLTYLLSEYLVYVTSHVEVISEAVSAIQNINVTLLGSTLINYESFVFSPSIMEILTTYLLVLGVVLLSATASLFSIIKYDERDILHVK